MTSRWLRHRCSSFGQHCKSENVCSVCCSTIISTKIRRPTYVESSVSFVVVLSLCLSCLASVLVSRWRVLGLLCPYMDMEHGGMHPLGRPTETSCTSGQRSMRDRRVTAKGCMICTAYVPFAAYVRGFADTDRTV